MSLSEASSRSSSVATTGSRPTISGIRPYLSKTSGSTWRKISPCFLSSGAMTLAPKPIEPCGNLGKAAGGVSLSQVLATPWLRDGLWWVSPALPWSKQSLIGMRGLFRSARHQSRLTVSPRDLVKAAPSVSLFLAHARLR
jgi:hypothetical protein